MGTLAVIHGKLSSDPVTKIKEGKGGNSIFLAALKIKSIRYDFIKRKKVSDLYSISCQGKIAEKIAERNEEGHEKALLKDDEVVILAEVQLHKDGPVYFAKEVKRLGDEGFIYNFICGAVESGKGGDFNNGDGHWAQARIRIPSESYKEEGEYFSSFANINAWDKKASVMTEHLIEDDSSDEFRKWAFLAGKGKTDKIEWQDDEGEDHVTYKYTTTVDVLEFTNISTEKYEFSSGPEAGGGDDVDNDDLLDNAEGYGDVEDDDVPF